VSDEPAEKPEAKRAGPPPRSLCVAIGVGEMSGGGLGLLLAGALMIASFTAGLLGGQGSSGGDSRWIAAMSLGVGLTSLYLLVVGWGTFKLRRWARPLMAVSTWLWLLSGAVATAIVSQALPRAWEMSTGAPTPLTRLGQQLSTTALTGLTAFGGLLLPALLAWAYHWRPVRDLFHEQGEGARWADDCPAPVLALVVLLGMGVVKCVGGSVVGVLPFFGFILGGAPASLGLILLAVGCGWLAWRCLRRRPDGWWGALGLLLASCLSVLISFTHHSPEDVLRAAGFAGAELAQLNTVIEAVPLTIPIWTMILTAVGAGYLLYLRRFFAFPKKPKPAPSTPDGAAG